ncbi:MAG: dihydroorotate dehydrogenase electron transfer subunit [Cytophagaceae bacterium]|jgi:dihydroorotate dehydrogenase electron transfer subunit|nr:dihydroorotate dehydrogenase electron transfer subunit [Cytophagaceae bacterium]
MRFIHDFTLVNNAKYAADVSVLTLQNDSDLPQIAAGQFVEVRVDNTPGVMLRRPISIHDVNYSKNQIKLMVQNVGKGTDALCRLAVGATLNVLYPLGAEFPVPEQGKQPLLIGGGCGVAPLLYLGRCFLNNGITPCFLLGFRSMSTLIETKTYSELGEVMITTEDGSVGHKGYVVNHPVMCSETPNFDTIYTCGPEIMMKAVAKYAEQHGMECYASLENRMACGIGACLCCVAPTVEGNKCTCVEGPVFNSKYLQW